MNGRGRRRIDEGAGAWILSKAPSYPTPTWNCCWYDIVDQRSAVTPRTVPAVSCFNRRPSRSSLVHLVVNQWRQDVLVAFVVRL